MITKLTTMYKFRWLEPKLRLQTSKACNSCVLGNVAHSLLGGRYPRINPTPPPPSAREGGEVNVCMPIPSSSIFISYQSPVFLEQLLCSTTRCSPQTGVWCTLKALKRALPFHIIVYSSVIDGYL